MLKKLNTVKFGLLGVLAIYFVFLGIIFVTFGGTVSIAMPDFTDLSNMIACNW